MKNLKLFFSVLSSLLLVGCIAAVIAVSAGGMVVYDKRSVKMIESDARIFYLINKSIAADKRFSGSRIVISSFNNVVLLAGQTPLASLRVVAEKIATNTKNVRRVYNAITVDYPESIARKSQDSFITTQIRSAMLTKKGLASGSIRVVTENGIVYLLGALSRPQADLAVDVARQVNGVIKVVKIFQYTR